MPDYPLVFQADHQDLWLTVAVAGLIGLSCLGIAFRLERKRPVKWPAGQRILLSMALFFGGLIALFTAASAVIQITRLPDILLTAEALQIGDDTIPLVQLKDATISNVGQRSLLRPDQVVRPSRVLQIESRSGAVHRLPEEHYQVGPLLDALRTAVRSVE